MSPEELRCTLAATCQSIELGNNGWADIGNNADVVAGVRAAGYVVILGRNAWGVPTHQGYTQRAQAALREAHRAGEGYAVSTYKPPVRRDDFDYEGAILDRQERDASNW